MQTKTAARTTLSQLARKKTLTGKDAGRALLLCTADSAKNGKPSEMPENVIDYINNHIHFSESDVVEYRRYLNVCTLLSQQRALADAHSQRIYGYVLSLIRTIEASYAIENAIMYFAKPEEAAAGYESRASFTGHGIEAYIDSLSVNSASICAGGLEDLNNFRLSARFVVSYNRIVSLIGDETGTDLSPLEVSAEPFDSRIKDFNNVRGMLTDIIASGSTPMRESKLSVLETYFGKLPYLCDISFTEESLDKARSLISGLRVFGTNMQQTIFDILETEG